MTDPTLVPQDALRGRRVALSVSESHDLSRLGLTKGHLDLVVAEVARAVLLAGGIIVYGGRLRPAGFTQLIIDEVERYSVDRLSLEIYVPASEHHQISSDELAEIDNRLGIAGRLFLLTPEGEPHSVQQRRMQHPSDDRFSTAEALTAMRKQISTRTDARVIAGGKLAGFQGTEPGVIEEARLTLEAGKALYVAGGYGGAASAVARTLDLDRFDWAPPDFPAGFEDVHVQGSLERLRVSSELAAVHDGLSSAQRSILAVSHRPANIATQVALGLAKVLG